MRLLARLLEPKATAYAHCDLPCGVYDPAQARIEAESVKAISQKYQDNSDPEFRTRALIIKEQRSELVKHHLWVLWTDYFKPPHFERYRAAPRAAWTSPPRTSFSLRSTRSPRSSGRPSRADLQHQRRTGGRAGCRAASGVVNRMCVGTDGAPCRGHRVNGRTRHHRRRPGRRVLSTRRGR